MSVRSLRKDAKKNQETVYLIMTRETVSIGM